MTRYYVSTLNTNMAKENVSIDFRQKKLKEQEIIF